MLDLNGHTVGNTTAGAGTMAYGVLATDQSNVTIRNGTVQGFMTGVAITAANPSDPGAASYGHVVERLNVNACTYEGISVAGADSVVRSCQVENIGGSTLLGDLASAYGIDFLGTGLRCLDCDVSTVTASGSDGVSYAIYLDGASDAFVVDNRMSGTQYGLYFAGSTGQYRHNLATGMLMQGYVGGTDAGKNIVDHSNNGVGDGVDDDWEIKYFGTINPDLTALAPNGEGMTILQAYQQGINPVSFYGSQTPTLTIVSGTPQSAAPGSFVPAPLVVQVADPNGNPISGAPVTFSVASGDGQLQASRNASPKTTVSVQTDANGQAQAFFRVSTTAGVTNSVNAFPTGTSPSNPQTFQETAIGNGPVNPAPPDDPNDPPTPEDVPVQNYAAIDVSGDLPLVDSTQSPLEVLPTLGDNNAVGFATHTDSNGPFPTYVWQNGTLGAPVTIPGAFDCPSPFLGDPPGPYRVQLGTVLPSGDVLGFCNGGIFSSVGGVMTNTYLPSYSPQAGDTYTPTAGYFTAVASNGTVASVATLPQWDVPGLPSLVEAAFVRVGRSYTIFAPANNLASTDIAATVITDPLGFDWIIAVNRSGQALGYSSDSTTVFWDGASLVPLAGHPTALNDQGQATLVGGGGASNREGYLWENGTPTILVNKLPAEIAGKISSIQPTAISNQTTPGTDATVYILATANVTQPDGTVAANTPLVCTRDNDGDWSFTQIGVSYGTTISQYVTINSSGTIAGIGSNSEDSGSNAQAQPNGLHTQQTGTNQRAKLLITPKLVFNTTKPYATDDKAVVAARKAYNWNYQVGVLASDSHNGHAIKSWPYEYIYTIKPDNSGATTFQNAPTDMAIFEDNSYVVYYYRNYHYFTESQPAKILPLHTYNPFGYFSYTNPASPATPIMYAFDSPELLVQQTYDTMKLDIVNQYVYAITISAYPLFKNPNKGDVAHDPVKEKLGKPVKHTFYITCYSDNPDGTGPYHWSLSDD